MALTDKEARAVHDMIEDYRVRYENLYAEYSDFYEKRYNVVSWLWLRVLWPVMLTSGVFAVVSVFNNTGRMSDATASNVYFYWCMALCWTIIGMVFYTTQRIRKLNEADLDVTEPS